jgi:hypothetical protein
MLLAPRPPGIGGRPTSRGRRSLREFTGLVHGPFTFELSGQFRVPESASERALSANWTEGDMVFVAPEVHFITGFDTEFVAQFLGNHDLSLWSDAVSHTGEYNHDSGLMPIVCGALTPA